MVDLHAVVVAEVERLERLYGGDRKDLRNAALLAALEMHGPGWHNERGAFCHTCGELLPCPELRGIADALQINLPEPVRGQG